MSSSDAESGISRQITPPNIVESAKNITANLLPTKSRNKYEEEYEKFIEWKTTKQTKSFSENVLLTYFDELSHKYKPSTLWSRYSMLKSTISTKNNVDISTYSKLSAFLKRQSTGFKSKKSRVLTSTDIEKFLNEAPDNKYLATKAALVLGITGACRREELCNLTMEHINDTGSMMLITIPHTKTYIQRSFTVVGEFYNILKTYAALRPENTTSNRFFLNYQNGKCTQQVIGINKFGAMPKQIATFLNLPDPDSYTGHAFRRTSATLLADAGADITTLKRHGGWKSNQVAEGYIEDSLNNKTAICKKITQTVQVHPSTSAIDSNKINAMLEEPSAKKSKGVAYKCPKSDDEPTSKTTDETSTKKSDSLHIIVNCTNVTIHYAVNKN